MKVNMSMIFEAAEGPVDACPRCGTVTGTMENVAIQW